MKTIGTKLRAVILLMLALVMLATVGVTTAFAIGASTGAGSTGAATAPDDTGKIENLTGWFDITSGPDGVKITLTPDKEALKGINKEQINSLASSLVEAIKELVTDDVVDGVLGDASLTDENFFETVLDNYIEGKYTDRLEFFKAVVNDADVEAAFISYVCETLLANSIRFGVLSPEDVPTADEIAATITKSINNEIQNRIDAEFEAFVNEYIFGVKYDPEKPSVPEKPGVVDKYVSWLVNINKTETGIEAEVQTYIDAKVNEFVQNKINSYLGKQGYLPLGNGAVDTAIKDYFEIEIYDLLYTKLGQYITSATHTTGNASLDTLIKNEIVNYIKGHVNDAAYADYIEAYVDDYIAYKNGAITGLSQETQAFYATLTNRIDGNIERWMDDYVDFRVNGNQIGVDAEGTFTNHLYSILNDAYGSTSVEEIQAAWSSERDRIFEEIKNELFADENRDDLYAVVKGELVSLMNGSGADFDNFVFSYIGKLWNGDEQENIKTEIKAALDAENKEKLTNEVVGSAALVQQLRSVLFSVSDKNDNGVIDEEEKSYLDALKADILATVNDIIGPVIDDIKKGSSEDANIQAVIEKIDSLKATEIDNYCDANFGMSYNDLVGEGGRISDIVATFEVSYAKALETKPFTTSDIYTLLESVKIGEYGDELHTVYGKKEGETGPHIYVDSIKALLKTVPTHTELLEMTSDTLILSYTVNVAINGFEKPAEFTVTLELAGSSLSYIQRGIQVIVDHVDFNVENDGTIVVDVRMPEIFTDALLKACNSGRIPESFKDKVFTALTATTDEAYALFTDLEYGEILTLIEKIDFNDILNADSAAEYLDYINKYIPELNLENLKTEDVIAKLEEYAGYFNKLKNYVAKAYSYVPDRVKDESVSSFYEGNGIFGYEGTVEKFDLAPIIYEVVARFNEDYALNISNNLLDKTVIENLSLDLSVSFFDIYEVEFYKPGETEPYRTGFLPVGADFKTFANLDAIDGNAVTGWRELVTDGEELDRMPARDVEIVAIVEIEEPEIVEIEINSSDITLQGGVFTGSPITPTVNVTGNEYYTVTVEADPMTNAGKGYTAKVILAVKEEYKDTHKLVVDGGEPCSEFAIEGLTWDIERQKIYVTPVGLTTASGFIYTGENITVEMANPAVDADKIICQASGTLGHDVGEYYATMVLALTEDCKGNYEICFQNVPDGITAGSFDEATESASYTLKWVITPQEIDLEGGLDWALDFTFAFDQNGTSGVVHTPSYVFAGNNDALEFVLGGTTSASEPGEYTVTLEVALKDPANYKFKDSDEITVSLEKTWKINKINLDVSGITAADKIVDYDGSYYSFSIYDVVIPEELIGKVEISMPYHSYREVGEYGVKFTAKVKDAQHYTIGGETEVQLFTKTLIIRGSFVTETPIRVNGEEIGTITSVNGIPSTYNMIATDVSHLYSKAPIHAELAANKYPGMYAKVLLAYDFSFVDANGDTRTLVDEFTLTLYGVAGMFTNPNVIVVYIDENGNVAEDFLHAIDGNDVSFTTNHFSAYAIVEMVPEEQEEDSFPWWIILIIALATALIAVIIIIIVKKRSGKPTEDPTEPTAETPVDEAPEITEATPIEEPVEEAPAEEPVEEAPIEELVEEAPAEEPAEEAPVTEVPEVVAAEPEKKSDDGENFGQRIINGQVVLVSYRSSYMSRLIQADTEIQDYYTVIKNTLLSYKGVKSRISWNFESFNKGRIQCVKLNLKGRALLVYIGLEPSEYNASKYHFTDVSDKPKFEKVPMLMKVKSDRGLKYVLELIDEMMRKLEIPQGEMPNEDYHMPYETTEALVERDLVKVILPPGVTLDENSSIEKIDVSELIDSANANKAADAPELPAEEPAVEEAVVEEPVAEAVEAPAAEHENEVHVDAVHADELLTDTEAEAQIEVIERTSLMTSTKMAEINLDTICENYEDDETVDLDSLKTKRLVNKNAGRIKVLARGIMTKRLVIIADKFSLQAVKMITLAGGHAEQLK